MRTGRTEALDITRKWLSGGALLRCNLDLRGIAAAFRGRLRVVTDDRLELISDDKTSELVLLLAPDFEFGYAEPTLPEEKASAVSGLVIFLSPTGPGLDPDAVVLMELLES